MLGSLVRFMRRIRAIKHVRLMGNGSRFVFAGSVNIRCGKGAQIMVNNGIVRLGYPLPGHIHHASYATSEITLEAGAILQFNGNTCIAPGATLFIGKDATATFEGNNFISHNFKLICTKEFRMGQFSNASWNVTLIDDDKHRFRRPDGQILRGLPRPLIIGNNVGLQMNASIPRGVRIGNCSVIAGGMTVREDIPEYSTAFEEVKVKVKHGFCCGPVPEQK